MGVKNKTSGILRRRNGTKIFNKERAKNLKSGADSFMDREDAKMKIKKNPERGQLIHDLIVTMNGETEYNDDFEKDIQRRVKKIKSGKAVGIPAVEAFSRIEAKY